MNSSHSLKPIKKVIFWEGEKKKGTWGCSELIKIRSIVLYDEASI